MHRFLMALCLLFATTLPAGAFEECQFGFEVDTQSSALQALVNDAQSRGGFWRPINEAPDDVREIGQYVGRLQICLRTPDGKSRRLQVQGSSHEIKSPFVTTCTATLLPENRLLVNRHCFYEPRLVAAGFTLVHEARVNFGYVAADTTDTVRTFLVASRELAEDRVTDAMVLQIISGDANDALGGHFPLKMETAVTPRRALTMIHHPRGQPQQFSSGTCQVHPRQVEIPEGGTQLRHSCESAGGSSGSLLLDARSLAVVGLHNQGGLSARGGFNGGHKIAAVEAALSLGFTPVEGVGPVARSDPEAKANAAMIAAFLEQDLTRRRAALQAVIAAFPDTKAAQSAESALALLTPKPEDKPADKPTAKPEDTPERDPNLPQVYTVRKDGNGDFDTLLPALQAAKDGDRIEIAPGTYKINVALTKALDIVGVGDPAKIVLTSDALLVLNWTADGGSLRNVSFLQKFAKSTALRVEGGRLDVSDVTITARGNYGMFVSNGTVTIRKSKLTGKAHSLLRVESGSRVVMEDSEISNADKFGFVVTGGSIADVRRSKIIGAGAASVLYNKGSKGVVENSTIIDGADASIRVEDRAGPVFRKNTIINNRTRAVWLQGGASPEFAGNSIRASGDGVLVYDAAPVFDGNTINGLGNYAITLRDEAQGTYVNNDLRGRNGAIYYPRDRSRVTLSGNRE